MDDLNNNEIAKSAEHDGASSPIRGSSKGGSARARWCVTVAPTRLFVASVDSIKKDRDKYHSLNRMVSSDDKLVANGLSPDGPDGSSNDVRPQPSCLLDEMRHNPTVANADDGCEDVKTSEDAAIDEAQTEESHGCCGTCDSPPAPTPPFIHQWGTASAPQDASPSPGYISHSAEFSSHLWGYFPPAFSSPPPPPHLETDKRFQCLQNLHNPPRPSFHGYQLIGDSMLLRFSQQLLGENVIVSESIRFLGYCVSGQKIGDLLKRLKSGFYHLSTKVVLMIGTNDLLSNTNHIQMCVQLRRVVDYLLESSVEELILLTLPPVPRLEKLTYHWFRLNKYNEFIKGLSTINRGIVVFDISPHYVVTQDELEEEELLAEFDEESPFCRGCLTCMEQDMEWDSSAMSDEDDIVDAALLTRVFRSTSPTVFNPVDVCTLLVDRRIPRCKTDCFERVFADNGQQDMIYLNKKGLSVVKDQLFRAI